MAEILVGGRLQPPPPPMFRKQNWGMLSLTGGTYRNILLISKDVLWFTPYMTVDNHYTYS